MKGRMASTLLQEIELAPVACCTPVAAPDITADQAGTLAVVFKALADPHRVEDREPPRQRRRAGLRLRLHARARSRSGDRQLPPQEVAGCRPARTRTARHLGLLLAQARRVEPAVSRLRGQGGRAMTNDTELREEVRTRYAEMATVVARGAGSACDCGHPGTSCAEEGHVFGPGLYEALADEHLPDEAVLASLGCGNPTAVADLRAGETVLDLGSG